MSDEINAPDHYIFGPYETIDIIEAWLTENDITPSAGFLWASMQQYLFRFIKKEKPARDLKKAEFYLKKLMELDE